MTRALPLLLLVCGCVRGAPVVKPQPAREPTACERSEAELSALIGRAPFTTIEQPCNAPACEVGRFTCRCEGPRGGAPRPAWWVCHQARAKEGGCPDDGALVEGAACATEGLACDAPRAFGCGVFTPMRCEDGRWTTPVERPCRAP